MASTSRTRVYELRKVDPAFAALWDEAEETATDALEAEARRRAIDGVELPVISMGKILKDADGNVVTIRRYSDQLLTLLLKGHRPQRFRDRAVIEHTGANAGPIQTQDVDATQVILNQLARIRARLIGGAAGGSQSEPAGEGEGVGGEDQEPAPWWVI